MTNDVLVIHHMKPRTKLFSPSEATLPIPLEYIDVLRHTQTNLDDANEAKKLDFWYDNANVSEPLTGTWTGTTTFYLLKPKPTKGFEWQDCRLTKVQARPDRPTYASRSCHTCLKRTSEKP